VLNCVQLVGRQVLLLLEFRGYALSRQMDLIVEWWFYTELTMLPTIEAEPTTGAYALRLIGLSSVCTSCLESPFRVISWIHRSRGRVPSVAAGTCGPYSVRLPLDSRRSGSVQQCKGNAARSLFFS
jgi:hypothetical protein